jgi:hypothetical protein
MLPIGLSKNYEKIAASGMVSNFTNSAWIDSSVSL